MVASEEWQEYRLRYGQVKAGQIKDSKATKVITACDNCLHQIKELGEHYNLGITTSNVSEHLAEAII